MLLDLEEGQKESFLWGLLQKIWLAISDLGGQDTYKTETDDYFHDYVPTVASP